MSIRINVASFAHEHTGGKKIVEVKGSTVAECIDDLTSQYPTIKDALFDEHGRLKHYLEFYLNGENCYPDGLARRVKDGDELFIVRNISGG